MEKKEKKRIIKDYDTLPEDIIARIKMQYPRGFAQHLVFYTNKDGKRVSALPFETEDIYYLVRMSVQDAHQIIEDDDDYDDDGVLRDDFTLDDYTANEDAGYDNSTPKFGDENLMYGMSEEEEETANKKKIGEDDLLLGMDLGDEDLPDDEYDDEDDDEEDSTEEPEDEDED